MKRGIEGEGVKVVVSDYERKRKGTKRYENQVKKKKVRLHPRLATNKRLLIILVREERSDRV